MNHPPHRGLVGTDVRAVFFDAIGTILFPEPPAAAAYAEVAHARGLSVSADEMRSRFARAYRAEDERDRAAGWVTGEVRERERWRRIVFASLEGAREPEGCFRELHRHFARPQSWRVNPDTARVLAALGGRDIRLGIASNYDGRLFDVVRGTPQLAPLGEAIVVSSAVGFRKPAAAFFDAVERAAGCGRAAVLLVGDDLENDYLGATAAGLQAALLDEGGKLGEGIRRISRLAELIDQV